MDLLLVPHELKVLAQIVLNSNSRWQYEKQSHLDIYLFKAVQHAQNQSLGGSGLCEMLKDNVD